MLEQGDIVLVPVPFTDLSSQKRRPVIVVSNTSFNRPIWLSWGMTSNPTVSDHSFLLTSGALRRGSLNRPGRVRVDEIFALSQGLIVNVFGRVDDATLDRIRQHFHDLTS